MICQLAHQANQSAGSSSLSFRHPLSRLSPYQELLGLEELLRGFWFIGCVLFVMSLKTCLPVSQFCSPSLRRFGRLIFALLCLPPACLRRLYPWIHLCLAKSAFGSCSYKCYTLPVTSSHWCPGTSIGFHQPCPCFSLQPPAASGLKELLSCLLYWPTPNDPNHIDGV